MTFEPYTHHGIGTEYYMCPNCVTDWKCNGPHIDDVDLPQYNAGMQAVYESALRDAVEAVKRVQHSDDCYSLYDENARCVCEIRPALAAIEAQVQGVWGGTTTADRKRMKRRARR